MINSISTENFTIWWENPLLIEHNNSNVTADNEKDGSSAQNRALLWGIAGVFTGVLFAASVLFRRYKKGFIEGVPKPFIEEE